MLRLFIAIDLPPAIKTLLRTLQGELRPRAPAVRWADPDGTHLTLLFLGATPEAMLEPVIGALHGVAAGAQPFELRTAALGAFPKPSQPRIVWLGVEGELAALGTLQAAVVDAVAPLGFRGEERPFAPHLTLGRAGRDVSGAELHAIASALREVRVPQAAPFTVRGIVLMSSEGTTSLPSRPERLAQGARYTVVAEAPFGAAQL